MKETVFKVGDRVYCILNGWGEVKDIFTVGTFPLEVTFPDENDDESTERYYSLRYYSLDGRWNKQSQPTLSFTEYTLNGFSQERPMELPEVGEEIMVSNNELIWSVAFFESYHMKSECPVSTLGSTKFRYFKRLR